MVTRAGVTPSGTPWNLGRRETAQLTFNAGPLVLMALIDAATSGARLASPT
jgi:hypothetical protein